MLQYMRRADDEVKRIACGEFFAMPDACCADIRLAAQAKLHTNADLKSAAIRFPKGKKLLKIRAGVKYKGFRRVFFREEIIHMIRDAQGFQAKGDGTFYHRLRACFGIFGICCVGMIICCDQRKVPFLSFCCPNNHEKQMPGIPVQEKPPAGSVYAVFFTSEKSIFTDIS